MNSNNLKPGCLYIINPRYFNLTQANLSGYSIFLHEIIKNIMIVRTVSDLKKEYIFFYVKKLKSNFYKFIFNNRIIYLNQHDIEKLTPLLIELEFNLK